MKRHRAKTITRIIKGIYVTNETPDMIRHLLLHARASVMHSVKMKCYGHESGIHSPYSTCGSSSTTAFSLSATISSTNLLVWGTPTNHVAHHTGNTRKPIKNNQAHRGLPPLSAQLVLSHLFWSFSILEGNDRDQGVLCIGAGFLGSRI